MGDPKDVLDPLWYVHRLQAAGLGQLLHQIFGVEPFLLGYSLEVGVAFNQLGVVHDVANIAQGKQRLDTAGCSGDDANGTGRRNGGWR